VTRITPLRRLLLVATVMAIVFAPGAVRDVEGPTRAAVDMTAAVLAPTTDSSLGSVPARPRDLDLPVPLDAVLAAGFGVVVAAVAARRVGAHHVAVPVEQVALRQHRRRGPPAFVI
jgi:hypothetical protein